MVKSLAKMIEDRAYPKSCRTSRRDPDAVPVGVRRMRWSAWGDEFVYCGTIFGLDVWGFPDRKKEEGRIGIQYGPQRKEYAWLFPPAGPGFYHTPLVEPYRRFETPDDDAIVMMARLAGVDI